MFPERTVPFRTIFLPSYLSPTSEDAVFLIPGNGLAFQVIFMLRTNARIATYIIGRLDATVRGT